jgi:endonuclease IV
MIFLSSSCFNDKTINEIISHCVHIKYYNLEISGGLQFDDNFIEILSEAKKQHPFKFMFHNYSPPPKNDFIINLASLDDDVYNRSLQHCMETIKISKLLQIKKFAFHAGFLIDPNLNEIGFQIKKKIIYNKNKSLIRFIEAINMLKHQASKDLDLYIENNVLSDKNMKNFNGKNPFLFTDFAGYKEINDSVQIKPLIDIGHLKVSAKTLDKEFVTELSKLINLTDYIHISDNNSFEDQNRGLDEGSNILKIIKKFDLSKKIITLEIKDSDEAILRNIDLIKDMINSK